MAPPILPLRRLLIAGSGLVACLALFLCSAAAHAQAREPGAFAVLEDPAGALTIEAVAAADAARFTPLPGGSFSGGFTGSAFWFRFTVAGRGEWWLDLLPPVLDDLRLYEPNPYEPDPARPGAFVERRGGDTLPFAARELAYRGFVFKLRHDEEAPRTYYLRLATTSAASLTPRLWRPDAFLDRAIQENGLLLAVLGVALAVALFNVHTWVLFGDRTTLWFVAYLAAFSGHLLGIGGYAQQYLFPGRPEWSFPLVSVLSFALIAITNGFYRRLFGITREQRVLYWFYEANCWLPLAALPFALAGYYGQIMTFFLRESVVMIALGVGLSLQLWRRGAMGGAMMLTANLISMGGLLVFVAHALGALAGGFFVWHSLQFSMLGSIIALQIALGARYRGLIEARLGAEQQARQEQAERLRQGQFLAMLAHELRTSLSVLTMALGTQPMTAKARASAERAVTSMGHVIDRSIEAQELADGRFVPQRCFCDLAALCETLIAESREPARIEARIGAHPGIETDVRLLRVVLANLLDNALKYGGVDAPVEVTLESGERPLVRVSNTIGAAGRPDPARVFEKYYRAPGAHARTGLGLGLYIAHGLAQLLGGELAYLPGQDRVCFELRL